MENIFKNAYFDKAYRTRDDRKAIYHYRMDNPTNDGEYDCWHFLIVENSNVHLICTSDGLQLGNHIDFPEWEDDIISEWEE